MDILKYLHSIYECHYHLDATYMWNYIEYHCTLVSEILFHTPIECLNTFQLIQIEHSAIHIVEVKKSNLNIFNLFLNSGIK